MQHAKERMRPLDLFRGRCQCTSRGQLLNIVVIWSILLHVQCRALETPMTLWQAAEIHKPTAIIVTFGKTVPHMSDPLKNRKRDFCCGLNNLNISTSPTKRYIPSSSEISHNLKTFIRPILLLVQNPQTTRVLKTIRKLRKYTQIGKQLSSRLDNQKKK